MIRILGQVLRLPIAAFVYSVEMLVKTIQGLQGMVDQSIDLVTGGVAQTVAEEPESEGDLNRVTVNVTDGAAQDGAEPIGKEEREMSDTCDDRDLSGDDLKLVRYKILFIRRDYEVAFPEHEELVSDDLTDTDFTAWKIAEFIQNLDRVERPSKWRKEHYPPGVAGKYVERLPEDDKKYLRVYYQVLDRFVREEANYEQDQINVLKQIRDRLRPLEVVNPPNRPLEVDIVGGGAPAQAAAPAGSPGSPPEQPEKKPK